MAKGNRGVSGKVNKAGGKVRKTGVDELVAARVKEQQAMAGDMKA